MNSETLAKLEALADKWDRETEEEFPAEGAISGHASELRHILAEAPGEPPGLREALGKVVTRMNRVTARWRHMKETRKSEMDDLCNIQLDAEEALKAAPAQSSAEGVRIDILRKMRFSIEKYLSDHRCALKLGDYEVMAEDCDAILSGAFTKEEIDEWQKIPSQSTAQSGAEGGLRAELLSILRHFTTVERDNPLVGYDEAIGYIRSRLKVAAQPTAQTPEGET